MTDAVWIREVRTRLCAQYPRVPAAEVDALLELWSRVLAARGAGPDDLRAAVEAHVQNVLHEMSALVPPPRRAPNPVRADAGRG
jgi:hypothetical protein